MMSSIRHASSTVRAIGPWCHSVPAGECGWTGTAPNVGLWPNRPQNPAGMRIEPPPSVARCSVPMPRAAAAAAPPLEPPGVRAVSQGLTVVPVRGLSVTPFQPNSGVVVLPMSTAPASRRRATGGPSTSQAWSASMVRDPRRVGHPLTRMRSLTVVGTPSIGLSGASSCHRRSDCRAASRALSPSITQNAL